jgi:hypothetical protein
LHAQQQSDAKGGFTATITPALLLISKLHVSHGYEEKQRECEDVKEIGQSALPMQKRKRKKI